uniref:Uncharacterized protein n=1 Tax=Arundo donax TaxID=35708 RepID=A0A0A9B475_ARUDO
MSIACSLRRIVVVIRRYVYAYDLRITTIYLIFV